MPGPRPSRIVLEAAKTGHGDKEWLKSNFQKLLLNFTWWVNRKDRSGRNVFEGGFLGLDNIGVFDRSAPLPTGGYLEQADGTAWMALFCQNMLEIAIELAKTDADYADMAVKFVEHFLWIASSMAHMGGDTGMWDEEDGFFYDVLRLPNGQSQRLKVRSMVGLLPLCAASTFDGALLKVYPELVERLQRFIQARPEIIVEIHDPSKPGVAGRHLASILDEHKLRRVLAKMLDENENSSVSSAFARCRGSTPNIPTCSTPADRTTGSNTCRPNPTPACSAAIPTGAARSGCRSTRLIIRALLQYYGYYGNDFKVECPTGSGRLMTLYQVAEEISRRLGNIFLKGDDGRRPVYGGSEKFQTDPHWRDLILFYEYFHGDNGAGLGASHQTGWTGIIARGMHLFATTTAEQMLELGKLAAVTDVNVPRVDPLVAAAT